VPFPYNVILGRDTAVPCPDFGNINNSDTTGFDITSFGFNYSSVEPQQLAAANIGNIFLQS
jgi:hypothetical protein